jgi:hypothetical protein
VEESITRYHITHIHHSLPTTSPCHPSHPSSLSHHEPHNARRTSKFDASMSPMQKGRPRKAVKMKRLPTMPPIHYTCNHVHMCTHWHLLVMTFHVHTYIMCPTSPNSLWYTILAHTARGHSYLGTF